MSYTRYKLSLIVATFLFVIACKETAKQKSPPSAYDLNNPEKFFMPNSLLEISGISFKNNTNDTVYAIQDEEGKVVGENHLVQQLDGEENGSFVQQSKQMCTE